MYRILIVEDDRGIAQAVAEQAKLWDLETCCVEDFRDVMGAFAAFDPHLVLLDISLPAFDGYHWCSRIRQVSKVPVIFISSAADSMNIVMAMNLGADDFIAKPFDQNVLMAKVLALLRRTYDFGQAVPVLEHAARCLAPGTEPSPIRAAGSPSRKTNTAFSSPSCRARAGLSAAKSSWSACGRRTALSMRTR